MFTVLIAEKSYIDAVKLENRLFFEPFLEKKELAFCYWNTEGQSLEESVPELVNTVGRKKEWRAVIIHNCTDGQAKQRNPFDIVDCSELDDLLMPSQNPANEENWDDWEKSWNSYFSLLRSGKERIYTKALKLPLQKLATWLNFRPEDFVLNDVGEKDDIHEWAINELSNGGVNPLVRLERMEREQYRSEIKLKEILRREFLGDVSLGIAYPKEIYCISKRIAEKGFFNPETYWNTHSKNEYSEFYDRNMYFDKMRFMVFDILPQTHKDYRCDEIRFLTTVLLFADNRIPGSTFEPRKLYSIESESDDDVLTAIVTSYDKKLSSTYDVINNEIERIYADIPGNLTDKMAESLFYSPINIEVRLNENTDFDALYPEDEFDLLPTDTGTEIVKWDASFRLSQKAYVDVIRQQRRSVKKGVDTLNLCSELSDANVSRLTAFQLEDIKNYTEKTEDDMVASMPPELAEASEYEEILKEKSDAVKEILKKRMSKAMAVVTGVIVLTIMLLMYAPFIVTNFSETETLSTAFGLLGGAVAVLVLVLSVALIIMKLPLIEAIRDFRNTMSNVVDEINCGLAEFSRYFGLLCNVRRGHKVQKYAAKNLDEYTKSIRIRRKHQEDIKKLRAELDESYHEFIGDSRYCENTTIQPYDFDFDKKVEYSYKAPSLAGLCKNIEFLESGNRVEVPSGYITKVFVRMEEIYDK